MKVIGQRSKIQGECPCCGFKTKESAGVVVLNEGHERAYLVHWTPKNPGDHMAFLISTGIQNHYVSALYSFEHNSFMVVGKDGYDWGFSGDYAILDREGVIGTLIADEVFTVIDVIWFQDRAVRRFHRKWTR